VSVFSEACSYLLILAVICSHLQLEISTFCLMVKGYLVFEAYIFAYEVILQVVLEILDKNNVTQPSQSSDAYTVKGGKLHFLQNNRKKWKSKIEKSKKLTLNPWGFFALLSALLILGKSSRPFIQRRLSK